MAITCQAMLVLQAALLVGSIVGTLAEVRELFLARTWL